MLIKMATKAQSNSPVGDMWFESDPTTGVDQDVDAIEKAALDLVSEVMFYRYAAAIPDQVKRVEEMIRYAKKEGMDESTFADPFYFDETATNWNDYELTGSDARTFCVNRSLL